MSEELEEDGGTTLRTRLVMHGGVELDVRERITTVRNYARKGREDATGLAVFSKSPRTRVVINLDAFLYAEELVR